MLMLMMVNVIKWKVKVLWSHGGELTRCIVLPMQAAQSAHLSSSFFVFVIDIIIISITIIVISIGISIIPVQVALSANLSSSSVLLGPLIYLIFVEIVLFNECMYAGHAIYTMHLWNLSLSPPPWTWPLARIVLLPPWLGLEGDPSSEGVPYKRCSTNADV